MAPLLHEQAGSIPLLSSMAKISLQEPLTAIVLRGGQSYG